MFWVVHPGSGSRIRILTFCPSRILDPGVKKAPDHGSGSATLVGIMSPLPLPPQASVSPLLNPKGGEQRSLVGGGVGGTQFERLDKKHDTLYTQLVMSFLYFSFLGDDRLCVDTLTSQ
jgi:hypothetical protein